MINCKCYGPDIVPGMVFQQRFVMPVPAYLVGRGTIIYEQLGSRVLEIDFNGADPVDYKSCAIVVDMTQGRSLIFQELYPVEAQINFLAVSGARIVTEKVQLRVGENMEMEVMTDE